MPRLFRRRVLRSPHRLISFSQVDVTSIGTLTASFAVDILTKSPLFLGSGGLVHTISCALRTEIEHCRIRSQRQQRLSCSTHLKLYILGECRTPFLDLENDLKRTGSVSRVPRVDVGHNVTLSGGPVLILLLNILHIYELDNVLCFMPCSGTHVGSGLVKCRFELFVYVEGQHHGGKHTFHRNPGDFCSDG